MSRKRTDEEYVAIVNKLLKDCGVSKRIHEISDCSPSMFIVLYESMFCERIPGINRNPTRSKHHINNMNLLLKSLRENVLSEHSELETVVDAEKLYRYRDERSIKVLVLLFDEIWEIIQEETEESDEDGSSGEEDELISASDESSTSSSITSSSLSSSISSPYSKSSDDILSELSLSDRTSSGSNISCLRIPTRKDSCVTSSSYDLLSSSAYESDKISDNLTYLPAPPKTVLREAYDMAIQKHKNHLENLEDDDSDSEKSEQRSRSTTSYKQKSRNSDLTNFVDDRGVQISSIEGSVKGELNDSNNSDKAIIVAHKRLSERLSQPKSYFSDINESNNRNSMKESFEEEDSVCNSTTSEEESIGEADEYNEDKLSHKYGDFEVPAESTDANHKSDVEETVSVVRKQRKPRPLMRLPLRNKVKVNNIHRKPLIPKKTTPGIRHVSRSPIIDLLVSGGKRKKNAKIRRPVSVIQSTDIDQNLLKYEKVYYNYLKSFVERVLSDEAHYQNEQIYHLSASEKDKKIEEIKFSRFKEEQERIILANMIERRSKEERFLRNVFAKILGIEKEGLLYEKMRRKEEEFALQRKNKLKLENIENFYQDQILMLKERVLQEKFDRRIAEKAQQEAARKLWNDVQENRKKELNLLRMKWQSQEEKRYHNQFNNEKFTKNLMNRIIL